MKTEPTADVPKDKLVWLCAQALSMCAAKYEYPDTPYEEEHQTASTYSVCNN